MKSRIHTMSMALLTSVAGVSAPALAQIAIVEDHVTILRTLEQFPEIPPGGEVSSWAGSVTSLGDLDGDGPSTAALAIGNHRMPLGIPTSEAGVVYIVFLDDQDQIIPEMTQRIPNPEAPDGDRFGQSCGAIGDVDGDGVTDLAVGAPTADDGAVNSGTLWIFLLYSNGTVKSTCKISNTTDMMNLISTEDAFAFSVAYLGVMNSPCGLRPAIAVGEINDDDGGFNTGAVWILFLDSDGTVACKQKINTVVGGFEGSLSVNDKFGYAVSALGDLDGDGVVDMAVGAPLDDHDNTNINADFGAIWVLFMNDNGTVREEARVIIDGIRFGAFFGSDIDVLGPLDDNHPEHITLAVGAPERNLNLNSLWLVEVDPFGGLVRENQIGPELDGYDNFEGFGSTLANMGDRDGSGFPELVVGDTGSDVAGHNHGALHILHLAEVTHDTDGDGLDDDFELEIGTDPLLADTDGDFLDDGIEVDLRGDGICPDPLNSDSDGDNILDGDEVNLTGTNPCLWDTDGDLIPDDIDPFPLDPGGTSGFIETELRDLAAVVEALDLNLIDAPNDNAARGRRNAMTHKLTAAANAVAAGDVASAIDQLLSLLSRLDGDPQPKDWMPESPERDALVDEIEHLLDLLDFL